VYSDCSPGDCPGRRTSGFGGGGSVGEGSGARRARLRSRLQLPGSRARARRARRGRDRQPPQRTRLATARRAGQRARQRRPTRREGTDLARSPHRADNVLRGLATAGEAPQRRPLPDRRRRARVSRAADLERDAPRRADLDRGRGAGGRRAADREAPADPLARLGRSARLPAPVRRATHARARLTHRGDVRRRRADDASGTAGAGLAAGGRRAGGLSGRARLPRRGGRPQRS